MKYSYVPESGPASDAYDPWSDFCRELFPAPQVSSREETPVTPIFPKPALALAELARENSWEVKVQYARGNMPHATTGQPGVLKDLVAVRCGDHPMTDRRAYAVYSRPASGGTWTWSSVMVWGPKLPPFAGCGITELKAYLMMPDSSDEGIASWVQDLKSIAQNGEILRKHRDIARKHVLEMSDAGFPFGEICEAVEHMFTAEDVEKIIKGRKAGEGREGMR